MKYLFLSINYSPEPTGFAPHVAAICEKLVRENNTVNIISGFPFSPNWHRWEGYENKWVLIQEINGVTVRRVTHFIPRRSGRFLDRILMESTFCLSAFFHIIINRLSEYDLIVYVGAQPSIALLSKIFSKLIQVPYVIEINDLASQAATDVGIIKTKFILSLITTFEFWSYNGSSGAVVLCSAFRDALINNGYPNSKIRIIPSPINLENIRPIMADDSFRKKYGLSKDDFIILYAGSMGLKQALINIINTAQILRAIRNDVKWIIVGDGEQNQYLKKKVLEYSLQGIVNILPFQDEKNLSKMFADADVLLLNQLSSLVDAVIPSKLLTYMSAGKPIVAAVNKKSQGAAILNESKGGLIVEPENPQALCNAVIPLKRKDPVLNQMGQLNREYAEQHFDQNKVVEAHMTFFNEIISSVIK